jgi:hypothetical protein
MTSEQKYRKAVEFLGRRFCLCEEQRAKRKTPFDASLPLYKFCFPSAVTAAAQQQRG